MSTSAESRRLLESWVMARLGPEPVRWFQEQVDRLSKSPKDKEVYLALGYATRKLGKADLALSREELAAAAAVKPGWDPSDWSIDQAARLAFVLASFDGDAVKFQKKLEQLFITADIGELIAFYRGLPLYPEPKLYLARAREGTRSAMQPIFEAVAHRNPYPRETFDENAWNQMVLKALFVDSKLHPIQGLDERSNPHLMRMLRDYAHERWAAGRAVSPELWRCVGPHADKPAVSDLAKVLKTGAANERRAAALALAACKLPEAADALATAGDLQSAVRSGQITWDDVVRN